MLPISVHSTLPKVVHAKLLITIVFEIQTVCPIFKFFLHKLGVVRAFSVEFCHCILFFIYFANIEIKSGFSGCPGGAQTDKKGRKRAKDQNNGKQ
jgi:hypothetical protein